MSIPAGRIKLFQDLVKLHDLRFMGNPLVVGEKAFVSIDGDHLSADACNAFFSDWARFNTMVRETVSPAWKRFFRRLGISI